MAEVVTRKNKDTLPSLSTRVEHSDFDVWGRPQSQHPSFSFDLEDSYYSADEDGSESEEGELDLARLLVDPKRQHSIQSLRRHLDREMRAGATPLTRSTSSLVQSCTHSAAASFRGGGGRRSARNMDMMGTWLPEDMHDAEEIDVNPHGEVFNGMLHGSGSRMGGKVFGRGREDRSYSRGRDGEDDDDDLSVRDLTMHRGEGSSAVEDGGGGGAAASTKRARRAFQNGWSE